MCRKRGSYAVWQRIATQCEMGTTHSGAGQPATDMPAVTEAIGEPVRAHAGPRSGAADRRQYGLCVRNAPIAKDNLAL